MMLTFRGESKEMLAIRMRWNKDGAAQVRSSMKFQNGKESKMELTSSTVGFKGKTIPLIALRSCTKCPSSGLLALGEEKVGVLWGL